VAGTAVFFLAVICSKEKERGNDNWFTRWFMVRHSRKLGRVVDPKRDYDFTDWEQVDALARELTGETAQVELMAIHCPPG